MTLFCYPRSGCREEVYCTGQKVLNCLPRPKLLVLRESFCLFLDPDEFVFASFIFEDKHKVLRIYGRDMSILSLEGDAIKAFQVATCRLGNSFAKTFNLIRLITSLEKDFLPVAGWLIEKLHKLKCIYWGLCI